MFTNSLPDSLKNTPVSQAGLLLKGSSLNTTGRASLILGQGWTLPNINEGVNECWKCVHECKNECCVSIFILFIAYQYKSVFILFFLFFR